MCLVLLQFSSLLTTQMTPMLSSNIFTKTTTWIFKSLSSRFTQVIFATRFDRLTYSAFNVLGVTTCCFLVIHMTGLLNTNVIFPVMNFLSSCSFAKSASTHPLMCLCLAHTSVSDFLCDKCTLEFSSNVCSAHCWDCSGTYSCYLL